MFRDATRADRTDFLTMWSAMYDELEQFDCFQRSDPATMKDVANLFDAYTDGTLAGVALLYEPPGDSPQGCMLAGESPGSMTIRSADAFGWVGHVWGIYMQPNSRTKRVGYYFCEKARKRLLEFGMQTLVFEVAVENVHALAIAKEIGCTQKAIVHTIDLRED